MAEETRAKRIDHIAVAVADLEAATELFTRLLGRGPVGSGESRRYGVRIVLFKVGESRLELLAPTDPDSTVAKFIARNGPGLHHVCYAVDDLAGTIERLENEGFELLGQGDEIGVEGRPVAFVHPKSSGGILSEFIEGREDDQETADA